MAVGGTVVVQSKRRRTSVSHRNLLQKIQFELWHFGKLSFDQFGPSAPTPEDVQGDSSC